ncbi:unnamed protein product, partial [Haemonchus placei]
METDKSEAVGNEPKCEDQNQEDDDMVSNVEHDDLSETEESEEEPKEQGQEERELNDGELGRNNIPDD